MSWLDYLIAAVILTSVIGSIVKGFTRELVMLAAAVLGFLMALWWYPLPARSLEPYTSTPGVAGFGGFLLILLFFLALGWMVSKLLARLIKATGLRWVDRLLGAAFGLVRGLLMAAVLVLALVAFAPGPKPIEAVAESRLAPVVLYGSRVVVTLAPRKLKESFQHGLERVRKVWREPGADAV